MLNALLDNNWWISYNDMYLQVDWLNVVGKSPPCCLSLKFGNYSKETHQRNYYCLWAWSCCYNIFIKSFEACCTSMITCTCIATRINQQAFLKWSARESNDILDLLQFNVCGHMKIPSQGGWLLILYPFIDHFSEYYYVFHLKDKIGNFYI